MSLKTRCFYLLFMLQAVNMHAMAQLADFNSWSAAVKTNQAADAAGGSVNIEAFGAIGDGITDDTQSFQKAFNYARDHDLFAINLSSGKKYKISNNIDIDYRSKGQLERRGVQLNGNGAAIFLSVKGKNSGYYTFNILTDPKPQQNTKFNFNNIWFYTDNVNRPNGIYNSYGNFVSISNCVFYQLATALNFQYAGMCRFDNCFFWGCVEGIKTYRCKDSYINGCHAFACDRAFTMEGVNNAGSDGNMCISNSVANSSTQYNLKMKGLYTPMISNCVFEQSPTNLYIQSCQFGKLSNVFSGPGNIKFISIGNDQSNDYWNIANLDAQGKVELNSLKFSNITGFKVHGVNSSDNQDNAAVVLNNCYEINIAALTIRDSRDNLKWSMAISPNCSSITISNLITDRSLLLKGNVRNRGGLLFVSSAIIKGSIETDDKQYKATEIFEYLNSADGTFHSNKLGRR